MKLYGVYLSPFARRVGVALISRGVAFEHDPLNGYASPERALELNPVGKVPVLVLPDGERVWDSGAILDHLDAAFGPERALLPVAGKARRDALRTAAIATALYEQATAAFLEAGRPAGARDEGQIERLDGRLRGGLAALDRAAAARSAAAEDLPDLATISAVVAFDYIGIARPHIDRPAAAPSLAALARAHADQPAFALTRPEAA